MTRRTAVSPLLLARIFGLVAAYLPSLLAESGYRQLGGGIAPSPELVDGHSRRALRSAPPVPPVGSTTTISCQVQFDGLALSDSAVDDFKAAYCAELVTATREASSFCHVSDISPSEPSGLLVTTGLYYPEPVPPTALNPDTLAAGLVVSPAFFFSSGFKNAYGNPTRGENVVVRGVYVPPPPQGPPEPPSPPNPAAPQLSDADRMPIPPPFVWWEVSPPPPRSPKAPSFPPQPSPSPPPGVPAQLNPSPSPFPAIPPMPGSFPPSPLRTPPAPPSPGVPAQLTLPPVPPAIPPFVLPAPSTAEEPSVPTGPEAPPDDAGGPPDAAGSPPAPSPPGSPPTPGSPDQIGCMQMAVIESLLTSQVQELEASSPSDKCDLGCLLDHFPTTAVTAPALRCVFSTIKCLDVRRAGLAEESEFLGTILRFLSCTMGWNLESSSTGNGGGFQETSPGSGVAPQVPFDSGTLIPFLQAMQAVMESPSSDPEIICDVMLTLRLLSELELRTIPDTTERNTLWNTLLDTVGIALEKFVPEEQSGGALAGYSDPLVGDSGQAQCSHFAWSLDRIFYAISEAVLEEMSTAGDTENIGPEHVRLMLTLRDIPDSSGLKFTVPALDDGNGRKRHRALAATEPAATKPEVDMPSSFSEACIVSVQDCPLPLPISISYTEDSDYLMQGLGTSTFVSAAADSANVSTAGLMVATVSGTIGIRLPLAAEELSTGLLGTEALLHFPLDGQVHGALGQDGKLCMRIDYDLMIPVVVGSPVVAKGFATCSVSSAGDFLVVQLAYALEDRSKGPGTYTATRVVQLQPVQGNAPPKAPPNRMRTTVLLACLVMAAVALCIVAVMCLRCESPTEDEDAWMYEGEEEEESRLLAPLTPDQAASPQLQKPRSPVQTAQGNRISREGGDASPLITSEEEKAFTRRVRRSTLPPSLPSHSPDAGASPEVSSPSQEAFRTLSSLLPSIPSLSPDSATYTPPSDGPSREAFRRVRRRSSILPILPRSRSYQRELPTENDEEQTIRKIVKMHVQGRRDRTGRTALHVAIAKRNIAAVRALTHPLAKHQSPLGESIFSDGSMQDSRMRNPLHAAAETGEPEIFQHLLTLAGGSVQQAVILRDIGGNTVLHLAARKGHTDIIAALQRVPGCDLKVDAQNRGGWTALQLAASEGELETVVQLLRSNPNIDLTAGNRPRGLKDIVSSNRTALHMASMLGRRDMVKALLHHMNRSGHSEQQHGTGAESIEPTRAQKPAWEISFSRMVQNFATFRFGSVSDDGGLAAEPEQNKEERANAITMASSMQKLVTRSSARQAPGPRRARRNSTGNGDVSANEGDVVLQSMEDVTAGYGHRCTSP